LQAAVELVAKTTLPMRLGHFFCLSLLQDGQTIQSSCGRDEYHVSTTCAPGMTVAATGRLSVVDIDFALHDGAAVPGPVVSDIGNSHVIRIRLRTNRFLSVADLSLSTDVRICLDGCSRNFSPEDVITGSSTPGVYFFEAQVAAPVQS
jgi:hypothetical protein